MTFSRQTEAFINKYVEAIRENNAVIFAGAGMSVSQGFFDWGTLLKPIAERLGLDIKDELHDLADLAQIFVDEHSGVRTELSQILTNEYSKIPQAVSENHKILARLPIALYWTTNYDKLIEEALKDIGKTPDVKKTETDLTVNRPRRDAIIYKMHGDIDTVAETVLTKHEYEDYNKTRELFSNAFKSDFVARTFLFIGFSFTDPNLTYLISRIRSTLGKNVKPDYYFLKIDPNAKIQRRNELKANSLKTYGLNAIWINDYKEITQILLEIEIRYLRNTVLISGSAQEYGAFGENRAKDFLHLLGKTISHNRFKIVSGFGLGIGSEVINGVLDNMTQEKNQNLDNYLILRPFPQVSPNPKVNIKTIWTHYRNNFIPLAGIAIFIFGNKLSPSTLEIVDASGMLEEFEIARSKGLKLIPIGSTGYVAKQLWMEVTTNFEKYYHNEPGLRSDFEALGNDKLDNVELLSIIINIVKILNSI